MSKQKITLTQSIIMMICVGLVAIFFSLACAILFYKMGYWSLMPFAFLPTMAWFNIFFMQRTKRSR